MLVFTTKEKLELENIFVGQNICQIIVRNKILTRGPDFSKNRKEKAIEFYQTHCNPDSLCLLVEHPYYFSLWKESEIKVKQKTQVSRR